MAMCIQKRSFSDWLWDAWCTVSVIGIWPRFLEPRALLPTAIDLFIQDLPHALDGFRVVHWSDLHFQRSLSDAFLDKLHTSIQQLDPHLILFGGDFLSYSHMDESLRLQTFLNRFSAPCGCFAVLGNHDYQEGVMVDEAGDYVKAHSAGSQTKKAFSRLYRGAPRITGKVTSHVQEIPPHVGLVEMLKETPFTLLHNQRVVISWQGAHLNLCGLGEHTLGRADVAATFAGYDTDLPGIISVHNPDAIPHLNSCPGELILAGHTHGGQVNLPWIRKRCTLMENDRYSKGLMHENGKWIYINRGVGSTWKFRWFALPEVLRITLKRGKKPHV